MSIKMSLMMSNQVTSNIQYSTSIWLFCEHVFLNKISGENLQRGQKSRHRLEELLRKVDSTARDRHSPEVEEEEKRVIAQNCIFFRRDILGREDRLEKKNAVIHLFEMRKKIEKEKWERKMRWDICLKMPRPGQRQQAQQQDQRLQWCWENRKTI